MSTPDHGSRQDALYRAAQTVLPGGVSSSIRHSKALGRPFYVSRGDGAYIYDLEGRQYVDLLTSHGATILGHNHAGIRAAIEEALRCGIVCASETATQSQVAAALTEMVPCIDMVRFTCSGTEATMHTLRLAREFTGREKFIKFDGHFHGYHDCYCYLPLYILCGEELLCAKLRPSNIDASAGAVQEVERIVRAIRARWPKVTIILRADSGFCR